MIEKKLFFELRTKEKKLSLSVAVTATLRQKCVPSSWGHLWDILSLSPICPKPKTKKKKSLYFFSLLIDGPDQIFHPHHMWCMYAICICRDVFEWPISTLTSDLLVFFNWWLVNSIWKIYLVFSFWIVWGTWVSLTLEQKFKPFWNSKLQKQILWVLILKSQRDKSSHCSSTTFCLLMSLNY